MVIGGIVIEACIFPAWIVELDRIEDSIDLLCNCCLAAFDVYSPSPSDCRGLAEAEGLGSGSLTAMSF